MSYSIGESRPDVAVVLSRPKELHPEAYQTILGMSPLALWPLVAIMVV